MSGSRSRSVSPIAIMSANRSGSIPMCASPSVLKSNGLFLRPSVCLRIDGKPGSANG